MEQAAAGSEKPQGRFEVLFGCTAGCCCTEMAAGCTAVGRTVDYSQSANCSGLVEEYSGSAGRYFGLVEDCSDLAEGCFDQDEDSLVQVGSGWSHTDCFGHTADPVACSEKSASSAYSVECSGLVRFGLGVEETALGC